ncbi:hypothetical protein M5K25_004184 [Dendrobium thyrsiflorum]|uniref:Uncharacterized protein n=1 Tax=Dendrobium thyrsiflorum TaxID=117978 RepID=A0ABD0VLJ7_DENTH
MYITLRMLTTTVKPMAGRIAAASTAPKMQKNLEATPTVELHRAKSKKKTIKMRRSRP